MPPALFETMRLDDGEIFLEADHLARLTSSLRYYGFPDRQEEVEWALWKAKSEHPVGLFRLRLVVPRSGSIHWHVEPLGSPWNDQGRLAPKPKAGLEGEVFSVPARVPIDETEDRWWHKRIDRSFYEERLAEGSEEVAVRQIPVPIGGFDVLLWNRAGRPTELTRANLVVERAGRLYTPPLEEGLLPGVFRGYLLAAGTLEEARISWEDLRAADRLYAINSVRGWMPLRIIFL
ncbi:branched-subunit amino acid aminotransferase/4-amino-4-deoxychorismate lyase [Brockia lithotrophica]|uniref:Branched-subunit amino acid aminotransferase/4-amino-4-deoxychorismate lyase n=2 Tax=Brockia lithotrophica TaxID=933949 RepID=A0A660L500_9BACL|nr:branched-subunit amino acid aminotransferase/4-amino-4-deoxychorismate lyase [Brockia lithotrophica]